MSISRLILLTATLLASHAAFADIVGGTEVRPKDPIRSATAALYAPSPDGQGGSLCTASIIGPHTAVTAAHCVSPNGPKPILIFGSDVRSPVAPKRPVSAVAVNPRWRTHQGRGMDQGDIALVKIRGSLPAGVEPIPMLEKDSPLKKGEPVELAGYGISDARRREGSGVLRKTKVSLENPRPGKKEMILDQSHGKGACHGDSGGPAFIRRRGRRVLVGVTNRSYPSKSPDDCAHKVVYTKTGAYSPWIRRTQARFERGSPAGARTALGSSRPELHRLYAHTEASHHIRSARARIARRIHATSRPSHHRTKHLRPSVQGRQRRKR